jgi:hypothetical protein
MGSLVPQKFLHLLVNLTNHRFREVASRHTGLIGDHHCLPSMLIQQSNCLTHSWKKEKSFDVIDVPYLLINGSIPIEKNGPVRHIRHLDNFLKIRN